MERQAFLDPLVSYVCDFFCRKTKKGQQAVAPHPFQLKQIILLNNIGNKSVRCNTQQIFGRKLKVSSIAPKRFINN
jgi:hypothetical protein